jgi:hypothetical protein
VVVGDEARDCTRLGHGGGNRHRKRLIVRNPENF